MHYPGKFNNDNKSNDGFGRFAAWLFGGVMTLALLDRGMTMVWHTAYTGWGSALSALGF